MVGSILTSEGWEVFLRNKTIRFSYSKWSRKNRNGGGIEFKMAGVAREGQEGRVLEGGEERALHWIRWKMSYVEGRPEQLGLKQVYFIQLNATTARPGTPRSCQLVGAVVTHLKGKLTNKTMVELMKVWELAILPNKTMASVNRGTVPSSYLGEERIKSFSMERRKARPTVARHIPIWRTRITRCLPPRNNVSILEKGQNQRQRGEPGGGASTASF